MPDDANKYLIDTDVLVHIGSRKDSVAIYDGIIALAKGGRLKTVRQVFGELKPYPRPLGVVTPHRDIFEIPAAEQFASRVQEKLTYIGNHAEWLWTQTGGKNPDAADPWLVAVASAYGYILVTDESRTSAKKIPAACKLTGCVANCIHGPQFLVGVGIVQEINPAHLDPHAFFSLS